MLVPYRKQQEQTTTTGRVRFRALCPFCNSTTFVIRYYCKRERLYYHLRIQNCGENEQIMQRSIAETQNMISIDQYGIKRDQSEGSVIETVDDAYSLSGSISQPAPSTVVYDQTGITAARDTQIQNERNLYGLNDLEGDLFTVLRNGLFYDTLIQCQDDVKLQVHRCILGKNKIYL
jgi:transcription elongation factor Elf1